MLIINSDDFLNGVLSEYLISCDARVYNSGGVALLPTMGLGEINTYEIATVNGYARQAVAFGAPSVVTLSGERYVQAVGTAEIRWTAEGGPLGGASVTHVGLISRTNTTPRIVHLIAVNPQETAPGSGVFTANTLSVTAGNALAFTPSVMFRDDMLA